MILYHMSQTLSLGDTLVCDHQKCTRLSEPFVQGLEQSEDCFVGMVLNAKYLFAVLSRSGLREWSDFAKDIPEETTVAFILSLYYLAFFIERSSTTL